jgi:hypothetical protein
MRASNEISSWSSCRQPTIRVIFLPGFMSGLRSYSQVFKRKPQMRSHPEPHPPTPGPSYPDWNPRLRPSNESLKWGLILIITSESMDPDHFPAWFSVWIEVLISGLRMRASNEVSSWSKCRNQRSGSPDRLSGLPFCLDRGPSLRSSNGSLKWCLVLIVTSASQGNDHFLAHLSVWIEVLVSGLQMRASNEVWPSSSRQKPKAF